METVDVEFVSYPSDPALRRNDNDVTVVAIWVTRGGWISKEVLETTNGSNDPIRNLPPCRCEGGSFFSGVSIVVVGSSGGWFLPMMVVRIGMVVVVVGIV